MYRRPLDIIHQKLTKLHPELMRFLTCSSACKSNDSNDSSVHRISTKEVGMKNTAKTESFEIAGKTLKDFLQRFITIRLNKCFRPRTFRMILLHFMLVKEKLDEALII